MIRILLVDDQNLMRMGIKALLDLEPELEIVGIVNDGRAAIEQTEILRPDVVLIDIEMPGMDGITATRYIRQRMPETKVLVLSTYDNEEYALSSLRAGANGYILKSSLTEDLKRAILAVYRGYSHVEGKLLTKVIDFQHNIDAVHSSPSKFDRANYYKKPSIKPYQKIIISEPQKKSEKKRKPLNHPGLKKRRKLKLQYEKLIPLLAVITMTILLLVSL